mmetsp:Transcript_32171/g.68886  ORF Transcript_32171/g.68886 Transcript_32171/m.68886 type:complete len:206 (-) Transcript_32171:565-1182(-)
MSAREGHADVSAKEGGSGRGAVEAAPLKGAAPPAAGGPATAAALPHAGFDAAALPALPAAGAEVGAALCAPAAAAAAEEAAPTPGLALLGGAPDRPAATTAAAVVMAVAGPGPPLGAGPPGASEAGAFPSEEPFAVVAGGLGLWGPVGPDGFAVGGEALLVEEAKAVAVAFAAAVACGVGAEEGGGGLLPMLGAATSTFGGAAGC